MFPDICYHDVGAYPCACPSGFVSAAEDGKPHCRIEMWFGLRGGRGVQTVGRFIFRRSHHFEQETAVLTPYLESTAHYAAHVHRVRRGHAHPHHDRHVFVVQHIFLRRLSLFGSQPGVIFSSVCRTTLDLMTRSCRSFVQAGLWYGHLGFADAFFRIVSACKTSHTLRVGSSSTSHRRS